MSTLSPAAADLDLDRANAHLADASAEEVVAWAAETFGEKLAMSTSFGAQSAVMLHLVTRVVPGIKVICIDTGYLFAETYRFADELQRRFGLNLEWASAEMSQARQEALYGRLWEQGDEGVQEYLRINKVEPMARKLEALDIQAWMAGLRGDQTEHRASLPRVGVQDGRVKIHPILRWSPEDVDAYIEANDLPLHPLVADGYRSIGDHHSTLPTTPDMDPRAGRILGQKQECGLHLPMSEEQNESYTSSGL